MLLQSTLLLFLITTFLLLVSILFLKYSKTLKNLPPSLPIIGHLYLLSHPLHHALRGLSALCGPVLLLRFGSRNVLTVTSPSAVDECFTKNDFIFANRPQFTHTKCVSYNYTALAAASYGPSLLSLRRMATVELFSPAPVRRLSCLLNQEVRLMIRELDVDDCGVEEGKRFRSMIEELFRELYEASAENFLPFIGWFGFKSHENRLVKLGREMDQLFNEMIEERWRERREEERTVIDVLLSLQETDGEQYSDEVTKGMILTLIAAGTHTTSATMEWAMLLLLNHPEALHRVKDEIDKQVNQDRLVGLNDVENLVYLNNVIKETLRLYPTVPLLLPHQSSEECTVEGFTIPSNTILFANAYAIHRDPGIWEGSAEFKPERFEEDGGRSAHGSRVYFPFGVGRRSCPGEGLAMLVVGLSLGTLIQCFEWNRVGEEKVDMSEGYGITMPKAKHLEAMYKPCQSMAHVLNNL